ncbi:uncharacterized protein APUU_41435A [Aspergillus puulaauensis]|uniref:Uncharacterized protein n=1 Tax=Aspergillus puulaauensis TaxID=1220207 RepID=A0A7R7XNX2_9EURO|nr:uncharacterized protein APUU_41435A [Aspergillus puulaauensis]BCS24991.1 hypothetical protein APUU_41435A [Aspergillus puulaauensis]
MAVCYMVVTPNPFTMPTIGSYFVKFGDGPSAQAYHRCNPSHAYTENHLAPAQYLDVQTYDYNLESRQPGKWLEWVHIKVTGGMEVYQRTEWHELEVKLEEDAEQLRDILCRMLDLFPYWNRWEEYAESDDATAEFENLVDGTWSFNHDEALARFVS